MSNRKRLTDGGEGGGNYPTDLYIRAAAMNERLEREDPAQARRVHFYVHEGAVKLGWTPEYRELVRRPHNRSGRYYTREEFERVVAEKGRELSVALDNGSILRRKDGSYGRAVRPDTFRPA